MLQNNLAMSEYAEYYQIDEDDAEIDD